MSPTLRNRLLALAGICGLGLSSLAASHFDDKETLQSYRQSWFALTAMNFGPIAATVKGEIPWDERRMNAWATDLETLTSLDLMRGFADGSDRGTTRAKPEIWQNKADFESKFADLQSEVTTLREVIAGGDQAAIAEQVGATGGACKACHDEYKSKDYLY